MKTKHKFILLLLRLGMGWLFLYAGISKILNPEWSAGGFLAGAKSFTGLFQWFASPSVLPIVNILNEWGLALIGVALILGFFTRIASFFGIVLMFLYYLPRIDPALFPKIGNSYIINEHIIYIFVLLLLIVFKAGKYWGIDSYRK